MAVAGLPADGGNIATLGVDFGPCHAVASGTHLLRRAGPTECDFFVDHGLCVL
jgi:hypothetical protein